MIYSDLLYQSAIVHLNFLSAAFVTCEIRHGGSQINLDRECSSQ